MKLYLHIGTEKTGSSFLQSYLANHRDLLLRHGIFFPNAGAREQNLMNGKITPGNAFELNTFLQEESWESTKKWMQKKFKESQENHCSSLLLSNEVLSITFSKKNVLKIFLDIVKSIGFQLQDILLIIREPVSQALSLYKHRTKEGIMLPIQQWLQEKYILADCLFGFYNELDQLEIAVQQYPYKKESAYLVEICINKWLILNEKIDVQHKTVNPSLTLSELSLLCDIFSKDELLSKEYYGFMLKLDANSKSDDKFYKNYIKNHINNYMVNYNRLWEIVHKHMSCKIDKYHYKTVEINNANNIASFSSTQIRAISDFVIYASSPKYKRYRRQTILKKAIVSITPKYLLELRKKVVYR